jgi:tetratricopeptide (TPR) repeat protein
LQSDQDELIARLENNFSTLQPPIELRKLLQIASTAEARTQGAAFDADVVVWCDSNSAVFSFEILEARGAPEAYEPETIMLQDPSPSQVSNLAYALGQYLRRDYANAANLLKTIAQREKAVDSKALLQLLRGNSLLFIQEYQSAAQAYQEAIRSRPRWPAAHHNLGLALMNKEWETYAFEPALAAFTTTLSLDPDFALAHIAGGQIWTWLGEVNVAEDPFQQAELSCQAALHASDTRILDQAQVCLTIIQVARYNLHLVEGPPSFADTDLRQFATSYWAGPLIAEGLAEYVLWKYSQSPVDRTRATHELVEALQASVDDVHLETSRLTHLWAQDALQQLD